MSRARELGKMFAHVGGATAGGLVPAIGVEYADENWEFAKNNWWALPAGMLAIGGLLIWKGNDWIKPIGYGMVGAAGYAGYQRYQAQDAQQAPAPAPGGEAGNLYGLDAGSVFLPPPVYQDAGALPPGYTYVNPYGVPYVVQSAPAPFVQ